MVWSQERKEGQLNIGAGSWRNLPDGVRGTVAQTGEQQVPRLSLEEAVVCVGTGESPVSSWSTDGAGCCGHRQMVFASCGPLSESSVRQQDEWTEVTRGWLFQSECYEITQKRIRVSVEAMCSHFPKESLKAPGSQLFECSPDACPVCEPISLRLPRALPSGQAGLCSDPDTAH